MGNKKRIVVFASGSGTNFININENITNGRKGSAARRPVSPKVQGVPTSQTVSHPNQSVVKMAAEKMKRKFLGWS